MIVLLECSIFSFFLCRIQQLLTHKAGNGFPVNAPLTHKVGIDATHVVVRARQGERLQLCRSGLCLLLPFAVFSAQQKQNRLLVREAVIALDEADGIATYPCGVVKPLVTPHSNARIIGSVVLPPERIGHSPWARSNDTRSVFWAWAFSSSVK